MTELVAQPLDGRPGDEHGAFEGVSGSPGRAAGDRRDQPVLRPDDLAAGVEQDEGARAVGVLDRARPESGLAEERGLLVPGDAHDGDARRETAQPDGPPELARGRPDLGQHGGGDAEEPEQVLVPGELADVVEHGPRGVGRIGGVALPAGELPEDPGIRRAEGQAAPLRPLPEAAPVEEPLGLGRREIGVDRQPRLFPDEAAQAGFGASSRQRSAVRRHCQTMALAAGRPDFRSQRTVVSRWLVMPTAAIDRPGTAARTFWMVR